MTKRNKSIVALCVLSFAGFAQSGAAHAGQNEVSNRNFCFLLQCGKYYPYMPRYNQEDSRIPASLFPNGDRNHSQLCSPTSTAMAMENIIASHVRISRNTQAMDFAGLNGIGDHVSYFASLLNTDVSNGTGGTARQSYSNMESGIPYASPTHRISSSTAISGDYLRDRVNYRDSGSLSNGWYKQTCRGTWFKKTCTYERDYGHVTAINGYYRNFFGKSIVRFYEPNPWWSQSIAAIEYYEMKNVSNSWNTTHLPPHGSRSRYKSSSFSGVYSFVENYYGINTN